MMPASPIAIARALALSAAALAATLTAPLAQAQSLDGVVTITQASAAAGGVTPGDAPGFPVTISRPGHYRLGGPLTVATEGQSAIQIVTDRVTLDLNGHSISGPATCTGSNPNMLYCQMTGNAGAGVSAPTRSQIRVHNGRVRGFHQGLHLGALCSAEGLDIEHTMIGMTLGTMSQAVGNAVYLAASRAISAHSGLVRDNRIWDAGIGVYSNASLVERNRIHSTGVAIQGYGQSSVGAVGNAITTYTTALMGVVPVGPNQCGAGLCP